MSGQETLASDLAAIKTAWRMLVRRIGKVEAVAALVDGQPSHVSEYGSSSSPRYVPADRILRAEMDLGEPLVTAALAAAQGYRLVPIEAGDEAPIGPLAARVAQEVGEAFGALATAQSDGKITAAERSVMLREFEQVQAAAGKVVAALRGGARR